MNFTVKLEVELGPETLATLKSLDEKLKAVIALDADRVGVVNEPVVAVASAKAENIEEEAEPEEVKPAKKKAAKKAKIEAVEETATPEEAAAPEETAKPEEAAKPAVTIDEVRAKGVEVITKYNAKATVVGLIKKYANGGKLEAVPVEDLPKLYEELEAVRG